MVQRPILFAAVVVAILALSGGYYIYSLSGVTGNTQTWTEVGATPGLFGENATQFPDAFIPNNFTVYEGYHVTLVFENKDDGPHEMVIPAFGVDTGLVQGGQTIRVNFVPDKLGTFSWSQPAGACNAGGLSPIQGGCTGDQETNGNLTVIAPP